MITGNRRRLAAACLLCFAPVAPHAPEPATPDATMRAAAPGSRSWLAEARRSIASREYEATDAGLGLQAPNRAHGLRTFFDTDGARVVDREGGSELARLRTVALGRGDALTPVAEGEVRADGDRVEIRRPGLVERFVNSETGLEQSWTLVSRPAGAGALTVALDLGAEIVSVTRDRACLDAGGRGLEYASPKAWDAVGSSLDARLERVPSGVAVVVDDEGAVYPVTIDPTLTSQAFARLESNQNAAFLGFSVAGAGDVNGDGYDDVIVGANLYDAGQTDEGAAFVFLGGPSGVGAGTPATAATTLQSNQAVAGFGESVAGAGDVNGDGFDDVVVGAFRYDTPTVDGGAAFVFLGGPGGVASGSPATASAALLSDQIGAAFGDDVASAGDTNDDGFGDLIVGATRYEAGIHTDEGAAFVFHGGPSGIPNGGPATAASLLQADQIDARMGVSVSGAGDTNGDGFDDVVVGASLYDPGILDDEGAAFVFLGSAIGVPSGNPASAAVLHSSQDLANFGDCVAGAGDVNADGFADVVVGAASYDLGQTGEGAAFVFLGGPAGVTPGDPATAGTTLQGDQIGANFGESVSGAGDVNADGFGDVVVGAPGFDAGESAEGAAFVFLGGPSGVQSAGAAAAASTVLSDQASANLGHDVAFAGDVDRDGFDDVIVGAPTFDAGNSDEGAAFVFLGGAYGLAGYPHPATTLQSNQTFGGLGESVAGAGDVNGDGYDDVVVGADTYDAGQSDEGAAFVFLGGPSGVANASPATAAAFLQSNQAGARLGISVSGAGDVNGDGFADVVVGADGYDSGQTDEGAAFVFLGGPSGVQSGNPTTAATTIQSNQTGAGLGVSVSGAGDVNHDGYDECVVGASLYDSGQIDEGVAFVFLGSPEGIENGNPATAVSTIQPDLPGVHLGISVAGAGDTNGDGFADVVVGADGYDSGQTDEGAAFVLLGGPSGVASGNPVVTGTTLQSNQTSAGFGVSVSGAGDVNADGYDDVVVGAYLYDSGQTDEGAAFVFLGGPGGLENGTAATAATTLQSDQASALFGFDVASAGDVDGDGFADVVAGAPFYEIGATTSGAAFVFLGGSAGIADGGSRSAAATLAGPQAGSTLGTSVAGAGDVNGDGFDDVVVGVEGYDAGQTNEGAAFVYLLRRPPIGGSDTVGVYVAASGAWFLRNQNSSGAADSVFTYGGGGAGLVPLVGDWDGDGDSTPGLYAPATGAFFLRNSSSPGGADLVFTFGAGGPGILPIVGDWNGDGTDTVGLYVPASSVFFLRNQNAAGAADLTVGFGPAGAGWLPLVGDWDGDGDDTIALFAPSTSTFFLRTANASGPADLTFGFGPSGAGWMPLAGDFDGDGDDTVALYNASSGFFFLRNANAPGAADLVFGYGPAGVIPLVGDWDGS